MATRKRTSARKPAANKTAPVAKRTQGDRAEVVAHKVAPDVVVPPSPPEPRVDEFRLEETAGPVVADAGPASFELETDEPEDFDHADPPAVRTGQAGLTAEERAQVERFAAEMAFKKVEEHELKLGTAQDYDRQVEESEARAEAGSAPRYASDGSKLHDVAAEDAGAEFQRWQQSQISAAPSVNLATASRLAAGEQPPSAKPIDTGLQGSSALGQHMTPDKLDRWKADARKIGQYTPVARQAMERGLALCFVWKGDTCFGFMTPDEMEGLRAFNVGIEFVTVHS
jgi:hypothetical protein